MVFGIWSLRTKQMRANGKFSLGTKPKQMVFGIQHKTNAINSDTISNLTPFIHKPIFVLNTKQKQMAALLCLFVQ